jgi:orotidine-5'-phosphate decarboxylase
MENNLLVVTQREESKIKNNKIEGSKIIVALDYADAASALNLVAQLDPALCKLKVGKELFTAAGPALLEQLIAKNFQVFLDLKFHDIPSTVKKACQAAANLGVWMLNVHASGGSAMLQAALEGVQYSHYQPRLIAVTVLTSMQQANLTEIGVTQSLEQQVLTLAKLTHQAGLHGVVCSALEAQLLKQHLPSDFLLVTPGIRPASATSDDQSRIVTPRQALSMGASYLVIGRPITQAAHPLAALTQIYTEIKRLP